MVQASNAEFQEKHLLQRNVVLGGMQRRGEDSRSIAKNDDKMADNQKHIKSPISNNHVKVQLFCSEVYTCFACGIKFQSFIDVAAK